MIFFDGSKVNLLIAFLGGVLTFFASCLLPLVPIYVAHMTGTIYNHKPKKKEIFLNSLMFTGGFIIIFIIFGLSASSFGLLLKINRSLIQKIGGLFFILVGFFMLGIIKPGFLLKERHFELEPKYHRAKLLNSFLFGLTFGFAWSPCIGPVLAVILFWATQAETVVKGSLLLFVYGLGIAFPFIFIGLFFEKFGQKLMENQRLGRILNISAAILIILAGLLLISGQYLALTVPLLRLLKMNTLSI